MKYSKNLTDEQKLFLETLRFTELNIIYAKKLVRDSKWHTNPVMNTNELYFCVRGGFHLVIDDKRYYIDKNKMVNIPANVYRDFYIEKGKTAEFYVTQFSAEARAKQFFSFINPIPAIDMTKHEAEVTRLFQGMADIGEPMTPSDVMRRIGYAGELLALFLDVGDAQIELPKHRSKIDFSSVMQYIDAYYRFEKISVKGLAGLARVSEGYFRREFKKEYGMSCKEYIESRRVEGVLKMLRESDESLKTIAKNWNYSDSAFLSRVIKKKTGLSPTEYRRKYNIKQKK